MRIAIFSDTYPPEINGVATSCRNLYRTLKKHGEEVLVITTNPYGRELAKDGDIVRVSGIKLDFLYGYRASWLYSSGAMRILREFKPDVIHIQTDAGIGQFGFLAARYLKVPTVYTFHTMVEDYTYYATKGFFDRAAKGIVRSYIRHKSHSADEFIAPSEKIREYMRSIGVDTYINIVPTGIDFSTFKRENIDMDEVLAIRKSLNIDEDAYVFLSLGRVAKEKSIDICLMAYAEFLKDKKNAKRKTLFVVVGGGPALEELKKLAEELAITDHVIFVGPVAPDSVPLYYRLGNAFLSASVTETQGLTFMEAMASDLVLLARYDDTLTNTIEDGKNGFFFIDEHDLAERMPDIMDMSKEELSKLVENAKISIEPYSIEKFYQNAIKTYERAIRKAW